MLEWLAKWILFFILRILSWTYRIESLDFDNRTKAQKLHPLGSYLLAFWHEHLLSPLFFFHGAKHSVLISDSRDGQIIGFQCRKFGYTVIHGSQNRDGKDKGGLRALIGMLTELRNGSPVAITVDGSIGPRRYVKAGVIELARKSNAAIVPFASAASRYWTLKTWDQFKIPKPFAKIIVQFGTPIEVPSTLTKDDIPKLQEFLEKAINEQEKKAIAYLKSPDFSAP